MTNPAWELVSGPNLQRNRLCLWQKVTSLCQSRNQSQNRPKGTSSDKLHGTCKFANLHLREHIPYVLGRPNCWYNGKCQRSRIVFGSYVYRNVENTPDGHRVEYNRFLTDMLSTAERILGRAYRLAGTASGAIYILVVSGVCQCPSGLTCHPGCRLHRWSYASGVFRISEVSRVAGESCAWPELEYAISAIQGHRQL